MRAIQIAEYGTNDVLHEIQTDRPTPRAGEVLVKVHAAGVTAVRVFCTPTAPSCQNCAAWSQPARCGRTSPRWCP